MEREILIVSADLPLFQGIAKACEKTCPNNISIAHVSDTKAAADRLRAHSVALVIIGRPANEESIISLLFYIWHSFPDIPVLNIAGEQEFPESLVIEEEGLSLKSGPKVLPMKMWAEVIDQTLNREQESGFLLVNDVSNFAQMIENEVKTCILRIIDSSDSRLGILFFEKGKLKNARLKTVQGEIAAYAILSWDNVKITVQDSCYISPPKIQSNLQALLIESQVKKDHQEKSFSNSTVWIEAAQEEKQTYQKLLDQISFPQKEADEKANPAPSPPPESGGRKNGPFPMAVALALGLALIAAMIYIGTTQFNRSRPERIAVPQALSSAVPTREVIAPPSEIKPKADQAPSTIENQTVKPIPSSKDQSNATVAEKDEIESSPQQLTTPPKDIIIPDKSMAEKSTDESTTNKTISKPDPQAAASIPEQSMPLSPQNNLENTPTKSGTLVTPSPPINDTSDTNQPLNIEKTEQETKFSVYIHYSNDKNSRLAYSLADHLMAANIKVPLIEKSKYKNNDIRYFHTDEQGHANTLKIEVEGFLKEKFPRKSGIRFRMKNLARLYPDSPKGQLEIWLNLPGN